MIGAKPKYASSAAFLAMLAVATVCAASTYAFAHERDAQGSALASGEAPASVATQLPNRRALTLPEAVQIAQGRYPGRVVSAQTIQQGNGAVHEVRIIGNDGMVHTVRIDATAGVIRT